MTRTPRHGLALLLGLLAGALTGAACRAPLPTAPPVPREASEALTEARAALAARVEPEQLSDRGARARAAAERALALAPNWVAPRRFLDELERDALRAPEALARHLEALRADPFDAESLYLVARLEGSGEEERFRRAALEAPELAWAHHGLAWAAARRGSYATAERTQRKALSAARDPWERSYFAVYLARYLEAAGAVDDAARVLSDAGSDPELTAARRSEVGAELAELLLRSAESRESHERGYLLAGELLRRQELPGEWVLRLAAAMREAPIAKSRSARYTEIEACLASSVGPERDAARARLLAEKGRSGLALALYERADAAGVRAVGDARAERALIFAAGDPQRATEEWLRDLPERLLDAQGWPRDPRIARAARLAVEGDLAPPEARIELAEALITCGWFAEALSVADDLAADDASAALALRARVAAALDLLGHVQSVLASVLAQRSYGGLGVLGNARKVESLDDLLEALEPHARVYRQRVSADPALLPSASPRIGFGPFGELAHPGPWFDTEDERAERGRATEPVPGLARLFLELGRFGLFGSTPEGLDGVLLPAIWVEVARGEHLGAPWAGTLAWCEGRDVRSRSDRVGGGVAGAALHEGYWIDIETLRRERDHWRKLQVEWIDSAENAARLEAALEVGGRTLMDGEGPWAWADPLGEDDRVRLAVLRERRAGAAEPAQSATGRDLVGLDEVVAATAVHEEGHLCDRARFLPLERRWWRTLRFFAESGFSPTRALVRLEYRAQLVALAAVEDPRVVLAGTLSTVASTTDGTHRRAYRELMQDFLVELAERVRSGEPGYGHLDGERLLLHQLHHLDAEAVRSIAHRLARDEGLVQ